MADGLVETSRSGQVGCDRVCADGFDVGADRVGHFGDLNASALHVRNRCPKRLPEYSAKSRRALAGPAPPALLRYFIVPFPPRRTRGAARSGGATGLSVECS